MTWPDGSYVEPEGSGDGDVFYWVDASNEHAQIVLEVLAEFNPESAASLGVDGLDEAIIDYRSGLYERNRSASEAVLAELRKRLSAESDPKVRQDLDILIQALDDGLRSARLTRDNLLPYYNVSQTVFQGVRALVDPHLDRRSVGAHQDPAEGGRFDRATAFSSWMSTPATRPPGPSMPATCLAAWPWWPSWSMIWITARCHCAPNRWQ